MDGSAPLARRGVRPGAAGAVPRLEPAVLTDNHRQPPNSVPPSIRLARVEPSPRRHPAMLRAVAIDPDAVFDDAALHNELGLSASAVRRARRAGELRYTRKGQRTLYLGRWVLAWLGGETAGPEVGSA